MILIRSNLDVPDLEKRIDNVIQDMRPSEEEVQDRAGRWYSM